QRLFPDRHRAGAEGLTMPEFFLELFSEEIPARMQARAAEDLARLVGDSLDALSPRSRRPAAPNADRAPRRPSRRSPGSCASMAPTRSSYASRGTTGCSTSGR